MKRLPENLLLSVLSCLILSFMVSCKSSKLLSATFESDTVNQLPSTNPAGAPNGDQIKFNAGLGPQLKVQNSNTSGEKALHFMNEPVNIALQQRWLGFRGISSNLAETVWFTFAGRNTNPSGDVGIDLDDGAGHIIARMKIYLNGDVGLAKNIADNYTDIIGNVGQNAHTIIFTTSPSTLKYNVTVFQTGGNGFSVENKPMITTNALQFVNPAHPSISFLHVSTGSGNHHYIIESVSISKKKPS